LGLVAASCRVVGNLDAYRAAPSEVDLGSRPSFATVVAFGRIEVSPSCRAFAVVASFPVVGIHPSFEEAARILVGRIVEVAFIRNPVATSYLAIGSPFAVNHILAVASSMVSPSFQVAGHTWVTEVDSRVVAFLPSLVAATCQASSVEEAYRPS